MRPLAVLMQGIKSVQMDLNVRVGDVAIEGMIEGHEVPRVNEDGKSSSSCAERGMVIGNSFLKKVIH